MYHFNFETKEEVKQVIFEYIKVFYNRLRMHSANDCLSPVEFEKAHKFN
ncbi:IS3 family transposase [Rickettsiella massiliensis]